LRTEIKCRFRESNPDTVTHPSTNRAQRRFTSLIETNDVTTTPLHDGQYTNHRTITATILQAPCGPGAIPHSLLIPLLPHFVLYPLVSFTFPFSLSYLLHLFSCFSIPSHSTRILPLPFQARCRRRRLNLAFFTPRGAGVPPFRLCSALVHSLPHLLLFVTFSLCPFLIHFTYFLLLSIRSFLPESSHSVSRCEVVGGDRTWV